MKRKRSSKSSRYRKKRRYARRYRSRKYKRAAIRMINTALETKRRYFRTGDYLFNMAPAVGEMYKALYQPFNWMSQGSLDQGITGNAIYIKSFSLRGRISTLSNDPADYQGPMLWYIYLVRARDEVNTGSITEGLTDSQSTVNTWFTGGNNDPKMWFVNSSKCKILYRKKINYKNLQTTRSENNAGATSLQRSPYAIPFYCRVKINRMHYFKENEGGGLESGLFGKYYNYYWLITCSQPNNFNDVQGLFGATSLVTFKDP